MRWGLALPARGSPAGKVEFQSSSAVKIFPVRMCKPEKPGAAAGMGFICLARPFQGQTSKWTSCWRAVMRLCTSHVANGQRIFFHPVLSPSCQNICPAGFLLHFLISIFFCIPYILVYTWSKTVWKNVIAKV